jgi:hypothetical protein
VLAVVSAGLLLSLSGAPERLGITVQTIGAEGQDSDLDPIVVSEAIQKRLSFFIDLEPTLYDRRSGLAICGSDVRCLAEALAAAGLDSALIAAIDDSSSPRLITLQLIDCARAAARDSVVDEFSGDDVAAIERASSLAWRMIEKAGHRAGGRLVVEVEPTNADVTVGETPLGTKRAITLHPGSVLVTATREGWTRASAEAVLRTSEETKVHLVLEEEGDSITESPWFWIGAGAATAAIAGAIVAVVLIKPSPETADVCVHRGDPSACTP